MQAKVFYQCNQLCIGWNNFQKASFLKQKWFESCNEIERNADSGEGKNILVRYERTVTAYMNDGKTYKSSALCYLQLWSNVVVEVFLNEFEVFGPKISYGYSDITGIWLVLKK